MQYADIQGFTIHFTHRYLLSDLFTIRRLRNYLIIRLPGCGRSGILIKLLRLPGGVSLSLQPWLDVSFAHIACGFQLWHEVRLRIARTSPDKSRSWQKPLCPQPLALRQILFAKHFSNWIEHASTISSDAEVAARAKACLILLPLHDGDETRNSWKPLLNTS